LDDIRPLRKMAANNGKVFTKKITAFETPVAYQATYRSAPGYDYSNFGLWNADNRPRGAEISFYVVPTKDTTAKKDTSSRMRSDSVFVRIYNDKNEVIRNLRWKADTGLNRQYWGMEERGYRQPGSGRPGGGGGGGGGGGFGGAEPAGLQVFPGTYKVVLSLGRESDSTFVTIKDDPRLNKTDDVKLAQRKLLDKLRKTSDKLVTGMDRLGEAEDVLTKITTEIRGLQGMDSLRKATTAMQDSIKLIREYVSGKNYDGQAGPKPPQVTVLARMQIAQQYITSKSVAPGPQEDALVKTAEDLINEAVKRINKFFDTTWSNYRKQVEGTKINLFKDYKPIE